jgi:hypothetical protein
VGPLPDDCQAPPNRLESLKDKALLTVLNETGRPLRVYHYRKRVEGEKAEAGWGHIDVVGESCNIDEWRGGCHYFVLDIGGTVPPRRVTVGWRDTLWDNPAEKVFLHRQLIVREAALLHGADMNVAVQLVFGKPR